MDSDIKKDTEETSSDHYASIMTAGKEYFSYIVIAIVVILVLILMAYLTKLRKENPSASSTTEESCDDEEANPSGYDIYKTIKEIYKIQDKIIAVC